MTPYTHDWGVTEHLGAPSPSPHPHLTWGNSHHPPPPVPTSMREARRRLSPAWSCHWSRWWPAPWLRPTPPRRSTREVFSGRPVHSTLHNSGRSTGPCRLRSPGTGIHTIGAGARGGGGGWSWRRRLVEAAAEVAAAAKAEAAAAAEVAGGSWGASTLELEKVSVTITPVHGQCNVSSKLL